MKLSRFLFKVRAIKSSELRSIGGDGEPKDNTSIYLRGKLSNLKASKYFSVYPFTGIMEANTPGPKWELKAVVNGVGQSSIPLYAAAFFLPLFPTL